MRQVILLFGPAGAGKTTIARTSPNDFTIYDRDDPQWAPHGEAHFRQAIAQLAHQPDARAVVIRAGATSTARRQATQLIQATHAYLVLADPATCHYRAGHRRRHDVRINHASIDTWFAKHERKDGVPNWPGSWDAALHQTPLPTTLAPAEADWEW